MARRQDGREDESRRILKQIGQETDVGQSFIERSARRARDHMTAADADQQDPAELWGTRIGRILGAVLFVVLVAYLVSFVLGA